MLGRLQQDEKILWPTKYDIRKVVNNVATKNSNMETSMETRETHALGQEGDRMVKFKEKKKPSNKVSICVLLSIAVTFRELQKWKYMSDIHGWI